MDENKEFLTSENEAGENATSDMDTSIEKQPETANAESSGYDLSNFDDEAKAETVEATPDGVPETDVVSAGETAKVQTAIKKKRYIQVPIIIAGAIVLVTALAFFIVKAFFDTSITGMWVYTEEYPQTVVSTSDEAETIELKNYFEFKNDGTVALTVGTISYVGTYSVETGDDNTKSLNMNVANSIQGTFSLEISGNIFTGRTLTITNNASSGESTQIVLHTATYTAPEIKREGDFTPNENLIGKWKYDNGFNSLCFEFRKDGTATYTENDSVIINGIYSYTDSEITLTYYTIEETPMIAPYKLEDGKLVINGITFTKDTGSTTDEGNK